MRRRPEPMPALLLLSHRSEGAEENAALRSVRDAIEGNSHLALRTLALGPLAQEAARELALRSLPEVQRFFEDLDLLPPGVQIVHRWRPDPDTATDLTDAQVRTVSLGCRAHEGPVAGRSGQCVQRRSGNARA